MKQPNDIKRRNSDSGSLGQFLRSRGRFDHVSKTPAQCTTPRENYWIFHGSRQSAPGATLDIGRNAAKRAHRASKTSRKHWRKVA